jgi:choline dehydrogenase-like flavoprotein
MFASPFHLSSKLTQPPDSVLVVEYGYFSDIPGLAYDPFNPIDTSPPSLMYNITSVGTVKQFVGVGCVVGGGSAINTQVWMRGTSDDYDRWGAIGGEGSTWTWDRILPYFKKASPCDKLSYNENVTDGYNRVAHSTHQTPN